MPEPVADVMVGADGWTTVRWRLDIGEGETDVPIAMPPDAVRTFVETLLVHGVGSDPLPAMGIAGEPVTGIVLQVRAEAPRSLDLEWRVVTGPWQGMVRWGLSGESLISQIWVHVPAIPGLPGGPVRWSVEDVAGQRFRGPDAWELTSSAGTWVPLKSLTFGSDRHLVVHSDNEGSHLKWVARVPADELPKDGTEDWPMSAGGGLAAATLRRDDTVGGLEIAWQGPRDVRVERTVEETSGRGTRVARTGVTLEVVLPLLRRNRYRLVNGTSTTITAVVPDETQQGWHRIAPEDVDVATEGLAGWELTADPGDAAELVTVETGAREQRISLLDCPVETLVPIRDEPTIGEALKRTLEVVLARRRRIAEWDQRIDRRRPEILAAEDEIRRMAERSSTFDPDSAAAKSASEELARSREALRASQREIAEWMTSVTAARQELRSWLESKEAGE